MKKFFLAALLAFPMTSAHAAEAVIKAVKGTVSVRHPGTKTFVDVKPGQALRMNDRVKTGRGAIAQIAFKGGATVLVKENSKFALRKDKRGKLLAFSVGEFLIGLKHKLENGERFRVRTPVAVAAVRGTSFWGKADENQRTTYACFTGEIEVWSEGKSVTLKPGKKLSVLPGQVPSEPKPANIAPDFIKTFAVDGSLQGVDDIITSER